MSEVDHIKDIEKSVNQLLLYDIRTFKVTTKTGFSVNGPVSTHSDYPGGIWISWEDCLHYIPFGSIDHISVSNCNKYFL